ncbi:cytosolic acyl coenzyme A thioester hydrolase-like isoform X2 [Anneissia japonica]|nr:cytosolic acyl coenzyme A thioester hydrolase-like isoform X2 [Anneissia japonica]XP_033122485.1 cytosolic acyl coenzyme A thioester hydrolase-like isoform X2 [Anneissia japonica]XP_033122486.1 cytosolic acyl coenzyme A thioester hydrolase-like isoform X2 [Anneissia japonica]
MMTENEDECDVQICRLMKPDDANIAGNVHGGTILKMIEEAGIIASTRHCNNPAHMNDEYEPSVSALVRVETTDFLQPMFIGEVAELRGKVTYSAPHSVEVQVMVTAENLLKGTKRLTNFATLWYVPMSADEKGKVLPAPPLKCPSKDVEEAGRARYEAQKAERRRIGLGGRPSLLIKSNDFYDDDGSSETLTVSHSRSSLIHLVGPSDCNTYGYASGGVTMKLMDEVAGCVAARHCRTNIVTASMDATNFHKTVRLGSICHLTGRATFTSNRSLEIEVMVDTEYLLAGSDVRERAVHAFFTYVSLGPDGRTQPIPQLKVQTEGEKIRYEEGKLRYEQRKSKRAANKQSKPSTS